MVKKEGRLQRLFFFLVNFYNLYNEEKLYLEVKTMNIIMAIAVVIIAKFVLIAIDAMCSHPVEMDEETTETAA